MDVAPRSLPLVPASRIDFAPTDGRAPPPRTMRASPAPSYFFPPSPTHHQPSSPTQASLLRPAAQPTSDGGGPRSQQQQQQQGGWVRAPQPTVSMYNPTSGERSQSSGTAHHGSSSGVLPAATYSSPPPPQQQHFSGPQAVFGHNRPDLQLGGPPSPGGGGGGGGSFSGWQQQQPHAPDPASGGRGQLVSVTLPDGSTTTAVLDHATISRLLQGQGAQGPAITLSAAGRAPERTATPAGPWYSHLGGAPQGAAPSPGAPLADGRMGMYAPDPTGMSNQVPSAQQRQQQQQQTPAAFGLMQLKQQQHQLEAMLHEAVQQQAEQQQAAVQQAAETQQQMDAAQLQVLWGHRQQQQQQQAFSPSPPEAPSWLDVPSRPPPHHSMPPPSAPCAFPAAAHKGSNNGVHSRGQSRASGASSSDFELTAPSSPVFDLLEPRSGGGGGGGANGTLKIPTATVHSPQRGPSQPRRAAPPAIAPAAADAGGAAQDAANLVSSIGVELARNGISVEAVGGWLRSLPPADARAVRDAHAVEERRLADAAGGGGGASAASSPSSNGRGATAPAGPKGLPTSGGDGGDGLSAHSRRSSVEVPPVVETVPFVLDPSEFANNFAGFGFFAAEELGRSSLGDWEGAVPGSIAGAAGGGHHDLFSSSSLGFAPPTPALTTELAQRMSFELSAWSGSFSGAALGAAAAAAAGAAAAGCQPAAAWHSSPLQSAGFSAYSRETGFGSYDMGVGFF